MEPNTYCQICYEEIIQETYIIKFDCLHIICLKCYPYIAFDLLSSSQYLLNQRLLESFEQQYTCPVCTKGKALRNSREINAEFLKEHVNLKKREAQKIPICNLCNEKEANKFCEICHDNKEGFSCEDCGKANHSFANKKKNA